MTKEQYWKLFKETGIITYYLKYKKLAREDD